MSRSKDDILKQNLSFIYSREDPNNKILDPDKHSFRRSTVQTNNSGKNIFNDEYTIYNFQTPEHEGLMPGFETPVFLPKSGDVNPFPSYEHALQASKFINSKEQSTIKGTKEIVDIKRFVSKQLKENPDSMVVEWNTRCSLAIAEVLIRDKFMRNKQLKKMLMKTGHKKLIYRNDFNDQYWGVNHDGQGQNHYGKLLEKIRDEIDKERDINLWLRSHYPIIESIQARIKMSVSRDGVEVSEESRTFDERAILTVGKEEYQNDIGSSHASLSRIHALVFLTRDQQLNILDLDSANGTFIDSGATRLTPFTAFNLLKSNSDNDLSNTATTQQVVRFGAAPEQYTFSIDSDAQQHREQELFDKIEEKAQRDAAADADENTIFVRNINFSSTESEVRAFFSSCGEIVKLHMPKDKDNSSNNNRGIAFITFASYSGVMQALMLDGDELQGKYIKVKKSDNKKVDTAAAGTRDAAEGKKVGNSSKLDMDPKEAAKYGAGFSSAPSTVDQQQQGTKSKNKSDKSDIHSRRDDSRSPPRKSRPADNKSRHSERGRSRSRSDSRDRARDEGKSKKDKDKGKDRLRDKDKEHKKDKHKDKERHRDKERGRDKKDRNRDSRSRSRSRSADHRKRDIDKHSDKRRGYVSDESPPRRRAVTSSKNDDHSISPPRRGINTNNDKSSRGPTHRDSNSASPPRKRAAAAREASESPPRRGTQQQQRGRSNSSSSDSSSNISAARQQSKKRRIHSDDESPPRRRA